MRELGIFGSSLIIGFSGAIMPGPMFTMVIREVPVLGRWTGLIVCSGHAVLELLAVIALLLGLGHWMKLDPVLGTLSIVGGFVLIWMGYGMLRFKTVVGQEAAAEDAPASPSSTHVKAVSSGTDWNTRALKMGLQGGIVSLGNPYWILWWSTVGAGFVASSSRSGPAGVSAFYIGHILSDLIWFGFLSFVLSAGRKALHPAVYQWIIYTCGIFIMFMAVTFITKGIGLLF